MASDGNGGERLPLSRDRILAESAVMFRRLGYRRTTLEAVAQTLGVTRPALYYHFRSKLEILTEIQFTTMFALAAYTEVADNDDTTPSERFWAMLGRHARFVFEHVDECSTIFEDESELAPADRDHLRRLRREYTNRFVELYEAAIAAKEFSPADARLAAFAYLGATTWQYRWHRTDVGPPSDVAADAMIAALRGPR